jgi:hypothetical protein
MAAGNFTILNAAKLKVTNNTIKLGSDSFSLCLTTSSQVLTPGFTGTSGNAQYSDLTAELPTAAGYTLGGITLSTVTWTSTSGVVTFTSGTTYWTLTGVGITYKYAVIYDLTATNKDILGYFDSNTAGGSVSPGAGTFGISPNSSGWFTLT